MKVNPHIYQAIAHPCTKFKYKEDSILRFKVVRIVLSFFATVFTFGGLLCHAKKHLPRAVRFQEAHDSIKFDRGGHPNSIEFRDQKDLKKIAGRKCKPDTKKSFLERLSSVFNSSKKPKRKATAFPPTISNNDPAIRGLTTEFNEASRQEHQDSSDDILPPMPEAPKELKDYIGAGHTYRRGYYPKYDAEVKAWGDAYRKKYPTGDFE